MTTGGAGIFTLWFNDGSEKGQRLAYMQTVRESGDPVVPIQTKMFEMSNVDIWRNLLAPLTRSKKHGGG